MESKEKNPPSTSDLKQKNLGGGPLLPPPPFPLYVEDNKNHAKSIGILFF